MDCNELAGCERVLKWTAFPLCSATDSCWNRKLDSLALRGLLAEIGGGWLLQWRNWKQ